MFKNLFMAWLRSIKFSLKDKNVPINSENLWKNLKPSLFKNFINWKLDFTIHPVTFRDIYLSSSLDLKVLRLISERRKFPKNKFYSNSLRDVSKNFRQKLSSKIYFLHMVFANHQPLLTCTILILACYRKSERYEEKFSATRW